MNAGQDIFIKSAAGSIDGTCLNDLRFHSEAGNVNIIYIYYNSYYYYY